MGKWRSFKLIVATFLGLLVASLLLLYEVRRLRQEAENKLKDTTRKPEDAIDVEAYEKKLDETVEELKVIRAEEVVSKFHAAFGVKP